MGYSFFRVAVALVLVMNSPQAVVGRSAKDLRPAANQAYTQALMLTKESKSVLEFVKSERIEYCVGQYTYIDNQANLALVKLDDVSGDQKKARGALDDIQSTASTAHKCTRAMKEDGNARIKGLLGQMEGKNTILATMINNLYNTLLFLANA